NAVFASLVQDYRAAVARLSTEMANVRTTQIVVRDGPGGVLPDPRFYDLFGPVSQSIPESTLPADSGVLTLCTPAASNPAIARPSNVNYRSLAPELRFANYAFSPTLAETDQLPGLSECYDLAWTSLRETTTSFST